MKLEIEINLNLLFEISQWIKLWLFTSLGAWGGKIQTILVGMGGQVTSVVDYQDTKFELMTSSY